MHTHRHVARSATTFAIADGVSKRLRASEIGFRCVEHSVAPRGDFDHTTLARCTDARNGKGLAGVWTECIVAQNVEKHVGLIRLDRIEHVVDGDGIVVDGLDIHRHCSSR